MLLKLTVRACVMASLIRVVCLHAAERVMTDDGFEAHLGTNYLGPFLLSLLLLPIMLRTAEEVGNLSARLDPLIGLPVLGSRCMLSADGPLMQATFYTERRGDGLLCPDLGVAAAYC